MMRRVCGALGVKLVEWKGEITERASRSLLAERKCGNDKVSDNRNVTHLARSPGIGSELR
jgi:hypothetical protein